MLVYGLKLTLTCPKCKEAVKTSHLDTPKYDEFSKFVMAAKNGHDVYDCHPCTCCKIHQHTVRY